jgi:sugar lactone lactonase YvrE
MSRMLVGSALLAAALSVPAHLAAQTPNTISTIAGGGAPAGPATSVELISPSGLALDGAGNIYIGSSLGPQVLLLNSAGNVSVYAGTSFSAFGAQVGDGGPATSASFLQPIRVALDAAGNLYVADFGGGRIRKITTAGTITTVAGTGARCPSPTQACGDGGPAVQAMFSSAESIAIDAAGNLFVSGNAERRVRRIDATTGIITTIAGNGNPCAVPTAGCGDGGPATSATLTGVRSLAFDPSGNLYIGDTGSGRIRRVDHTTQTITTYAGNGVPCLNNPPCGDNGPATSGNVNPLDITFDGAGNLFTVQGTTLREVDAATQTLTTLAGQGATAGFSGDGKPAVNATLNGAFAVRVDAAGNIYVADSGNSRIRKVASAGPHIITTIAGGGSGGSGGAATSAILGNPVGITVDATGDPYFADFATNFVRKININPSATSITNIAGNGIALSSGDFGQATSASLATNGNSSTPALDAGGNLYISDTAGNYVRKVDLAGGIIAPAVGNGIVCVAPTMPCGDGAIALQANLNGPSSVAVDGSGGILVADGNDFRVRRVDPASGAIAAFAGTGNTCTTPTAPCGDGGPALQATFSNAGFMGLAVDDANNVFIADAGATRVRRVDALTGNISTVAGNGTTCGDPATACGDGGPATAANLNGPAAVAVDAEGNLFIADVFKIRRVDAVDGTIATIAGNGTVGYAGDAGLAPAASIGFAQGVAIDANQNLYLSDQLGNRIRTVHLAPTQSLTGTFGDFASQLVNTSSAPQSVTVSNTGLDSLVIASIVSSDTTNFATTNTCPGSQVAPGQTCAIRLTFSPVTAGILPTTVTITTNDATNPVTVFNLQGTGAAGGGGGGISFQPSSLTFASTPLAHVIVQETGGANPNTLGFTGAFGGTAPGSASGGTWNIAAGPWNTNYDIYELTAANQADLAAADGYSYTATYSNLSSNTSPTFGGAPFSYGSYANLSVNNIRFDLGMHSDGQGNQVLALNPFNANSPVFSIPGLGSNPVTLTLLYNNTTQLGDAYVNGVKVISGYAGNNSAFTGENVVFGGEQANFSNVELIAGLPTAAATASLTLTNSATAPLNFTAPAAISGPNAGDFTFAPGSTCAVGTAVPANGSCVLNLVFLPTAPGPRTATLTFSDDATPGTQTVTLNGTGAALNAPAVTLNPSSVGFPATSLNTTSAPSTVTLTNSGNAPLNLGSFGIDDGQNGGDFAISTRSTCSPQTVIAAGNSCTIILTFTPAALGERTATLSLSDNAAPGTQSIPLSGTGAGAGDFTIIPPGTTIVLNNGQTAKFPITISPAPGSTIEVTFFAPGPVPAGTCVFYPQPNPATVASTQTFNFLFTTNAPQPGLVAPLGSAPESPIAPLTVRTWLAQMVIALGWLALLRLLLLQKFGARGIFLPRYAALISVLVIAAISLTFVGCGGGGSSSTNGGTTSTAAPRGITVPGTYQIVISASSGTATHSTTVTVQIN